MYLNHFPIQIQQTGDNPLNPFKVPVRKPYDIEAEFLKLIEEQERPKLNTFPELVIVPMSSGKIKLYKLLIPGYRKEDLKITLKGKVITVVGELEDDSQFTTIPKSFTRNFTVTDISQIEDMKANLENGILKISVYGSSPDVKEIAIS